MKVFVFYSCRTYPTKSTYLIFLYSFRNYSKNEVYYQNLYYDQTMDFFNKVKPDLVVFYLIVFWDKNDFDNKIKLLKTAKFGNMVKAAFFQDEYSRTLYSVKLVNELKIPYVFSVAPKSEWGKIYEGIDKKAVIKQVLTTYVDNKDIERAKKGNNIRRDIDISYRTALDFPFHVGRFGLLKKELGETVRKAAVKYGLKTDISTAEKGMKFGSSWMDFLQRSKYVLGMESGASLLDKDGSIFMKVKSYLKDNPQADFKEVEKKCFPNMDGKLGLKAISPRHFEACLTKTCQILIEGEYNGILKPWVHYLPLKSDFSNLDEILNLVKEDKMRAKLTGNAYEAVTNGGKYTYSQFIPYFYSTVMGTMPKGLSKKEFALQTKIFDIWTWAVAYLVSRNHGLAVVVMKLYFRFKKLINC